MSDKANSARPLDLSVRRDFEVVDQHNGRHRFDGTKYWWAWRPTGEHSDIDDFKIVDVFRKSEDSDCENEVAFEFPYPAVVGDVDEGVCLSLREKPLLRCSRCGFTAPPNAG